MNIKRHSKTKTKRKSNYKKNKKGGFKAFVGQPLTNDPSGWPGIDGISGNHNYLKLNTYNHDIQRSQTLGGSSKRKRVKKTRKKRGGGIFSNLTSGLTYNLQSASNALRGFPPPTNPAPYVQFVNSK